MPISVALPAPSIEWLEYFYFPQLTFASSPPFTARNILAGTTIRPAESRNAVQQIGAGSINSFEGYGARTTGGTTNRMENRFGRPCVMILNTVNDAAIKNGAGMLPMPWSGVYDPPGGSLNPGALQDDASLCAVFDWHASVQLVGATVVAGADRVGFFFLPDTPTRDVNQTPGGGGVPVRGFGVFLNNVAGVPTWEYVSWADGGAILERVTIGASIVPSIVNWSTFRFVIQSAGAGGREPQLAVQVNGFDVVTGRVFGSGVLADPTSSGTAGGLWSAFCWGGGSDQLFYALSGKLGRFTPAGAELQGD
ncbi:MAG: hypothetical protein AB7T31_16830 [Gemmatimonadales bacterium]